MALTSFTTDSLRKEFDELPQGGTSVSAPEKVEFDLDGETLRAYKPKTWLLVELAEAAESNPIEQVKVFVKYMNDVMDDDSVQYLRNRLGDPEDTFDVEHLVPLMHWLIEQFGGKEGSAKRPTGRRTGSPGTPGKTGRGSQGRSGNPAKTQRRGRSTASSAST
jgi:hypothetical protein